jgi:diadenosine tetraphosphate (Ap4A) HIT family hydrolase
VQLDFARVEIAHEFDHAAFLGKGAARHADRQSRGNQRQNGLTAVESACGQLTDVHKKPYREETKTGLALLVAGGGRDVQGASMITGFTLHPQLAQDTVPLGDLALSRVLLANDANYPWLILVPRRANLTEIIHLSENDQVQLMAEIAATARALKAATECEKLNIAALGNMVAQLHVHVIARVHSDAAWPKPVWGAAAPAAYTPTVRDGLIRALRRGLQIERLSG